jgi:hypothetical protein
MNTNLYFNARHGSNVTGGTGATGPAGIFSGNIVGVTNLLVILINYPEILLRHQEHYQTFQQVQQI